MFKMKFLVSAFLVALMFGFGLTILMPTPTSAVGLPGPIDELCFPSQSHPIVMTVETGKNCMDDDEPYYLKQCLGEYLDGTLCDCEFYGCWGPDDDIE